MTWNMRTKQWSTRQTLHFPHCGSIWIALPVCPLFHAGGIHFPTCFYLKAFYSYVLGNITYIYHSHLFCVVLMGICLMCCWPSTAECTLIQAQRPDVHLLLDFFQPTVSLRSSAGLQLKLSVRFSCFPTTVSVNLPFKIQVQNYYAFKGQRTLC